MANLIHINTMRLMLNSGEAVSLKFWKDDGSIVSADNVICTTSHYKSNTFNLKFLTSKVFRTVRAITIFEINDMEVFI
ncbi:MAG: hypothetical protein LBP72_06620 [Dysgonamonadaceae bacterium]|jgi:hypothetical protein|nr:hypothetical protein [Dysgonamonadaceae bacterium]